jgi:DNA-directed RNA polymerase subunit RPC12/RpoP
MEQIAYFCLRCGESFYEPEGSPVMECPVCGSYKFMCCDDSDSYDERF